MDNRVQIVVGAQDNSRLDLDSLKRRLADMGRMIETARVNVSGDKEASLAVERMALKLARLGRSVASPKIGLEGAAKAEVEIEAVSLALDNLGSKASSSGGKLSGLRTAIGGVLKNLAGGAGGLAGGALGIGLAGPLAAAGAAIAGFGALAAPTLSKVQNALSQTGKAGAAAWKQLDPTQRQIGTSIKALEGQFSRAATAFEPVVASVVKLGARLGSDLIPAISKLAPAGAKVIDAFLVPLDTLLRSPVFGQFIGQMAQLAGQVAPMLGQSLAKLLVVFLQMFTQAGPAAVQILNQLVPAIVDMASGLVPVVAGVTKLVAVVVEWLAKNHMLIPALIAVGAAIAVASGGLTLIIPAIALVVGGLVHLYQTSQTFRNIVVTAFSVVGQAVLTWAELVLNEFHIVATGFLDMVHFLLVGAQAIAKAIDFVMGSHLADGVTGALNSFDRFKAGVDNVFNAAHSKLEGWKRDLANMPKVVALQGNITDLTNKLNAAKAQLRDPNLTATRRAQIQANIRQMEAQLARAKAELAAINGTVATTYVDTVYSSGPGTGPGAGHRGGHPLATGGITGAAGGGPRGNLTLVGEHGMELVSLPPGAYVHSNPDTQRMLAGGGPQVVRLEISGGQSDFDQFLMKWLKERVRVLGGGSVQVAFGRG